MIQIKRLLIKLLFPHILFAAVLIPAAAALLIYVFTCEGENPIITYTAYFLSTYALTVCCARIPNAINRFRMIKQENRYIRRYRADAGLRVRMSLCVSFAMNLAYALMQLGLGLINHSVWFYALTSYYAMLVVMRYFLLHEARRNRFGKDKFFEYLIYRLCGVLLLLMNIALSSIVFYIVRQNRGFEYHYIMTIAMAAYTFFSFALATVNIVRYRKYDSPVISASKAISLVSAIVSMLSLETAMLAAFGGESDAVFRQVITACTGAAACIAVFAIAVYMIVRSTKEIKRIKGVSVNGKQQ